MASPFTLGSLALRFLFALVLVMASYNPSGWSYFHWLRESLPGVGPWRVLVGLLLLIGWTIFLRATFRSLGGLGLVLLVALLGTLLWVAIDLGLLATGSFDAMAYAVLLSLSAALAVGMSWSHVRRRLSGQLDVDDVDED